jgi:hypothetical protein
MGGMPYPRVCEMGANNGDVGFKGCNLEGKYTVPVRSIAKAKEPIYAGRHVKDWEPANGPNTTPQAGVGGAVYINFPIG